MVTFGVLVEVGGGVVVVFGGGLLLVVVFDFVHPANIKVKIIKLNMIKFLPAYKGFIVPRFLDVISSKSGDPNHRRLICSTLRA